MNEPEPWTFFFPQNVVCHRATAKAVQEALHSESGFLETRDEEGNLDTVINIHHCSIIRRGIHMPQQYPAPAILKAVQIARPQ